MVAEATPDEPETDLSHSLRELYERAAAIPDGPRRVHWTLTLLDQAYWLGYNDALDPPRP